MAEGSHTAEDSSLAEDSHTAADVVLTGEAAPPMANGELVFEAPWQARLFGMAVSLAEVGLYTWDEFRKHLIDSVGAWDQATATEGGYEYYHHFEAALLAVLDEKGVELAQALSVRTAEFAVRPHGHDH